VRGRPGVGEPLSSGQTPPLRLCALLRPDSFALTALLALLTALGPMSVDLYLPSLPDIERALRAPAAQVELTISFYLIGFALGQIFYGPLSDLYGRKPVLLAALGIFCVMTFVCAGASSIEALIAARFVQAVGASGAIVLSRAIVRDLHSGARAARELSLMAMIFGFAPIVAPLIGGGLQTAFGWRAGFLFVFLWGAGALTAAWWLLPETLRARPVMRPRLLDHFRGAALILRNTFFLAHVGIVALSFSGLFAWISGSAFVLQDLYGATPVEFALVFAIASIGYLVGTSVAAFTVMRLGIERTIGAGAAVLTIGAAALVAAGGAWPGVPVALAVPVAIYLAGLGLAMPQAMAGALQPFPERAGTASSLVGCTQQTAAALMGAVVGHTLGATAWPLILSMALMGAATLVLWLAIRGREMEHASAKGE